jgi:hypothetical protein
MTTIIKLNVVKTSKLISTVPTDEKHDGIFGSGNFNASILGMFSWYMACRRFSVKINTQYYVHLLIREHPFYCPLVFSASQDAVISTFRTAHAFICLVHGTWQFLCSDHNKQTKTNSVA